jgi:branched-chain amino acid aminotransferase
LLDPDGFIAEGTGDNFFIVKNNAIVTPEGRNILRGISRAYIFELAEQLNLKCTEKNIEPYDVYTADEAFMTGTPFCILPVTSLNSVQIGNGKMGVLTKTLLDKWSENVGVDIVAQIKEFNKSSQTGRTNAPTPYSFSITK